MKEFLQTIFRGIGQVMLQNNAWSGILFSIGILINAPILSLAAFMGAVFSTLTAKWLRYSSEDIENGLYGFNGALVGILTWFFFDVTLITGLFLIPGAAFSTWIQFQMKKFIPPYTAPFVIVGWILLLIIPVVSNLEILKSDVIFDDTTHFYYASAKGFGQVMFQENEITEIFFLIGILVNSRISALYALYASLISILIAILLSIPDASINAGLMGYNGILCAIALSCV